MSILLEMAGVSKSFPGVKALDDVHLELRAGEVHAIVGENGAGKSTLMKILSGVYQKDAGEIRIEGTPLAVDNPKQAQQLGISIIHQELNLIPDLTVAQNIYIGREARRWIVLRDEKLNGAADRLLDELGIDLRARQRVGDLTVAQQQMVEIAKALSFPETKILIMDEPTSAISLSEAEVLFGLIESLRKRNVGILYISHRMEELRRLSDRVTVLRDGHYVGSHPTAEVTDAEIITMMVGRELVADGERRDGPHDGDVRLSVKGLSTAGLLRDVSFELRAGEILGFAGLIGAGRTETARSVVGADPISSGTIEVDGRPVRIGHPSTAASLGIGYLPEDRKSQGLMLDQDVEFNISMTALDRYRGPLATLQRGSIRDVAAEYVESLSIKTPSTRTPVRNLSGGNQQKVVIAKWLARNCDVLIFDEPTRGIDVGAKEEIYKLLQQLAEQGKGIIVISSDLPEVLRLSHRILVMSQGRVTGELDGCDADQETIMTLATMNIDTDQEKTIA